MSTVIEPATSKKIDDTLPTAEEVGRIVDSTGPEGAPVEPSGDERSATDAAAAPPAGPGDGVVQGEPQDGFDPDLLGLAERSYGFLPEEARAFGSAENLQRALTAMDRRLLTEFRANQPRPSSPSADPVPPAAPPVQPTRQPDPPGPPVQPTALPRPSSQPAPFAELAGLKDFDEDEYPKDMIQRDVIYRQAIGGLHQQMSELQQMSERFRQQEEAMQAEQDARTMEEFNAAVVALGDTELLGAEPPTAPGTPAAAAWDRIFSTVLEMSQVAAQRGVPTPINDLVRRAYMFEFADRRETQVRSKLVADAQRQSARRLGTPSRMASPTTRPSSDDPDEREQQYEADALAAVKERMAQIEAEQG